MLLEPRYTGSMTSSRHLFQPDLDEPVSGNCFSGRCQKKKNGIMWEKFPSGGPPPPTPPVWEFSHFSTGFLPFYKPLNWKKQRKIWSGFGSDLSPQFGNFSDIIPFFSDNVPKMKLVSNIEQVPT